MALRRRSGQRMSGSIWPGFVDAMTALLLVLMFVLTIFMIVQFMLSETITGQESELDELTSEVNALAVALGLEQQRSFSLDEQVVLLGQTIDTAQQRSEVQSDVIAALTTQLETQSVELNQRAETIAGFENQVASYQAQVTSFEAQVTTLLSQRNEAQAQGRDLAQSNADLETARKDLITRQEAMQLALASARDEIDAQAETARLAAARRQALDALVADLRGQVSDTDASLADALARLDSSQANAASLDTDLSDAVASLATERDIAAALQARLSDAQQELTENEKTRLTEAAAAQTLRERLLNADDELTAMTLSLEEQRRKAEEMLTLLAAADAAKGDLNAKLAAALLAGDTLAQEVSAAKDGQTQTERQLNDVNIALAAALLAGDTLQSDVSNSQDSLTQIAQQLTDANAALEAARLAGDALQKEAAATNENQAQTALRLGDAITALEAAKLAGDNLASQLTIANQDQTETASRLATAQEALAIALLTRDRVARQLEDTETARLDALTRLAGVEDALAAALASRDGLRGDLEKQSSSSDQLAARLDAVETALTVMQAERDSLRTTLSTTNSTKTEIAERLTKAESALAAALAETETLKSGQADQDDLQALLTSALAAKLAAEREAAEQISAVEQREVLLSTANTNLQREEAISADGLRRMAVLNQQIAALRRQIGSLQALLEVAEAKDREANVEITNLSSRLNTALARVLVEERVRADLEAAERQRLEAQAKQLENYRSEFFGKMRAILGNREGVRIVGDRFVFSSEVLFEPASADLADDGRTQIAHVAEILAEVSSAIPPEIDWVIRVDGHTDNTALSGSGRYRDNWELSQARALSVVRFMTDELDFPANRLAATGFGEFQPVASGDSPEALAANRRIELKLTER